MDYAGGEIMSTYVSSLRVNHPEAIRALRSGQPVDVVADEVVREVREWWSDPSNLWGDDRPPTATEMDQLRRELLEVLPHYQQDEIVARNAARALAARSRSVSSEARAAASRANGAKGGRPRAGRSVNGS
jgi:hypothetical protein